MRREAENHTGDPALRVSLLILSSSEFGAPVSVPVQDILDLICRTLSVSAKNVVSGAGPAGGPFQGPLAAGQAGRGSHSAWFPPLSSCSYACAPAPRLPAWMGSRAAGALGAGASPADSELGVH